MDQDLVVRVQNGDQRAFETLATAGYPRLFRVAHGVLGDRDMAEDATQQALLAIGRKARVTSWSEASSACRWTGPQSARLRTGGYRGLAGFDPTLTL